MAGRHIPNVDEVRSYLSKFNFFERYVHGAEEGHVYNATHARRFVETLRRVPPAPDRPAILELGAVPYSMTLLLRRYIGGDVAPLSFYEVAPSEARHILESADGSETHAFEYQAVNVERDLFPFADATFDIVLCCEILEHLLINPGHMFHEAHRVLRPGGSLIVTTPNVIRAANVRALLEGRNINDAYHGNGIYGRHNREYAPDEVPLLLRSCGFEVLTNETVDVYDPNEPGPNEPGAIPGREDTIVTVARATGQPRTGTPPGLFVLMEEYLNVVRPAITMGVDDVGHLGRGWFDLEHEGEIGFRWSRQSASFHLKLFEARTVSLHAQAHHPDLRDRPVRVQLSMPGHAPIDRVITDHRWQDIDFELSRRMSGAVEAGLRLDRDWAPHEADGSGDRRRLGLRVHRCWSR